MIKNIAVLLLLVVGTFSGMQAQTKKSGQKLLRHVVLFSFKDAAPADGVKKVEEAFRGLSGKITEIKAFEWGTNNSPEKLNQGFTHCFFVTFQSEKDRDAYLVHKDHKAFVDILGPYLEKALVLDYWAND
jgi:hypothetical protein